ncbi:MAG TPA: hypothetical protein PKI93_02095 [Alphaproteobacteria bacterium]|nr:hypothetical protein [Alphaproteobacteria bacterium]HNS43996.1 hypothetical protein [Alphaproteobacteria bacterium]
MALSDIGLCSRALVKIGAHPIASFSDGTASSEIAGLLYDSVRDAVLSSYGWSFATGQVTLTRLTTAPAADYQYAYQLPNDFLRAISAGYPARGRGLSYRIQGRQLHINAEEVLLTYIYRPVEETFPPYFDMALIARLAAEFCIPLTENVSRSEVLSKLAEQEFTRARQIDAQQDSPNRIESFSLIDARE